VTYSDVGGCKEQIEKLREVVEMPLLHVSMHCNCYDVPRHLLQNVRAIIHHVSKKAMTP